MLNYIPIIVAFTLMFMGVPVAISLITSSIIYFGFITDTLPLTGVIQKLVSSNMSSTLLAIPFFMMIGTVMNYAGITKKLMYLCDCLVGHKTGGLGHVNVLLSTVNGGICGSGGADAAMQCKILVPEMTKRGYPLDFSAAVTAASGLIAPIIPPGAGLILYAIITETSVAKMFVAGYVPGILMCVAEMTVVSITAHKHHFPPSREHRASLKEVGKAFVESFWSVLVIFVLIVGLRMGIFTITEGAVIVIVLCFVVGFFFYKELKVSDIPKIFKESVHTTGTIMLMLLSALLFGMYLSWASIPQDIAAWMLTVTSSRLGFLFLAMLILLIMGMFLDGTAMLLIMTPLLWPVAKSYGIDAISFGILIIINSSIGSLTPPLGGVMYIVCNLLNLSIPKFVKAVWPFILCLLVLLVLLMVFPQIITWLPNLIYS